MKYLNIQGFKAVFGLQPAPHVGHKPAAHFSAVWTPPGDGRRFTDEIAPVSEDTHSHGHTQSSSCSTGLPCSSVTLEGEMTSRGATRSGSAVPVDSDMLKHSVIRSRLRSPAARITFSNRIHKATFIQRILVSCRVRCEKHSP